jgi:ABC-type Fe3+/spermidine/putrescine transport system ATPase subunit
MSTSSDNAPPIATRVIGVSKRFGKTGVLENISLDVAEGEILVLLGASGSGKTTILRIIAGLEQPNTGKIILHGRDVTELPARERGVGVHLSVVCAFSQDDGREEHRLRLKNSTSKAKRDPEDC